MLQKPKSLVSLVMLVLLMSGCYPDLVMDENKSMPNQVWSWKDPANFTFELVDTSSLYDLGVNVRINSDYPYQNLWLKLKSKTPEGDSSFARMELQLFDPSGIPLGQQTGTVWEYHIPAISGMSFQEQGPYTFTLEQNMRVNSLPGILDIGVFVEKAGEKF